MLSHRYLPFMSDITRNAIASALKELLLERPLSRITVCDISERCGISRMTFYYHFRDIYDLVGWIISSDILTILSGRKTYDTWQEGLLSIFQAVEKNHVFVLNACSSLSREQLERSLMKPVSGLISSVLEESPESAKLDSNDAAFISSFFSYAFIGIMLDWIDSGMREKPEDLVEKIECVIGGSFERAIPRFVSLRMKLPVRIPDSGGKL